MGFGWSFSPSAQPARVIGAQSCLPDSCQHLCQLQLSASQSSASDPGDMLHPHSAWHSLVLAHTTLESPTQRPQVLHVVKALSSVLFYLSWLCVAFLPFVLMFLSDLICIQITSPGGSPIRGKNAVRAFRHATSHHATPHHCCRRWSPPLHPVQSVTSPYPSCPLQSLHLQLQPPSATSHHTPPLSVISSCGLIHYKSALWTYQLRPPRMASPATWAFWASSTERTHLVPIANPSLNLRLA